MLLNKIPVLDKGYVALLDSSMTTSKLKSIGAEFFGGEYPVALEEYGTLTLVMKCPLFVQLTLTKYQFRVINSSSSLDLEAYLPNSTEVGSLNRLDSEAISDDIRRTTDALLINPKSYQSDGADRFISQIITPLNVYTTLVIQGSYSEWCKFAYQQAFVPVPIKAYLEVIKQIIEVEWKAF